mgnify:CR=1 FL=1|jgi:hypothetical protein
MKVKAMMINPLPDEDGYHIFECDNCHNIFLLDLSGFEHQNDIFCPFCGKNGNIITFTNKIREKIFQDHQIEMENVNNLTSDQIKELILVDDVEVIEYNVNEIVDIANYVMYEFICCDKFIKINKNSYKMVKYCCYCKGEVLYLDSEN